ncbi:uncharacterized protein LOC143032133 isoform X2 [Oratosquilla oratoria]|uniref:uncharacterized protein LOC143032133 isoform X2 n=1 Tax=Oratosquilla oratoria TaxID=337810 RepID=UPI003F765B72
MSCRECSDITGMLRERRRPEMMLQRVWRKHSSRTAVSTSAEVKHETITANDSISTSSSNKNDFIQHERIPESLDDTQPRFPIARQSMAQVDCPNGI